MKCGKEIKDGALFCNWCGCKTNLAEQEQKSVSDNNKEVNYSSNVIKGSSVQIVQNENASKEDKKTDNTRILRRIAELEHSKDNYLKMLIGFGGISIFLFFCMFLTRGAMIALIIVFVIVFGVGAYCSYNAYSRSNKEISELRNKLL